MQFVQRTSFDLNPSPDDRCEAKERNLELIRPLADGNGTNAIDFFNGIRNELSNTL